MEQKYIFKKSLIMSFMTFLVLISSFSVCGNGKRIISSLFTVQSNVYAADKNVVNSDLVSQFWLKDAIDACKKNAPVYFKEYWNRLWWIKYSTNCYAYAFDITKNPITEKYFKKNTAMQPGLLSRRQLSPKLYEGSVEGNKQFVDIVSKDMMEIGYTFIEAGADTPIPDKAYMVALCISPGNKEYVGDYHWYRLNPDGTWSHKPGFDNVTNVDKSGDIITDPFTADRGDYTCFVGYFYVVKNV